MYHETHFDYIIIGNGLSGLQLALGLSKDSFFDAHSIALIDPYAKTTNDKTWSFWEPGKGTWDHLVEKTWESAVFKSNYVSLSLSLQPYKYKTIKSLNFYNWAKDQLAAHKNIQFILDSVTSVEEYDTLRIIGDSSSYTATHVFDSRIPSDFFSKTSKHTLIHQHFKGWVIESEMPAFEPESFTMMDYRFKYKDSTSFMYVLPISSTKALVEFTFFTPYMVDNYIYDEVLASYVQNELKLENYQILETEIGNIPMTDFPFWKYHTKNSTKIGTAGGWVKGSTGYSFKHTEKNVAKLISNIKNGKAPSSGLIKSKFKFYDKIFLDVLKTENQKGPWIFERFYSKNSIQTMFRFLDEDTHFSEDLKIMKSLFSLAFIRSFFKVLFRS